MQFGAHSEYFFGFSAAVGDGQLRLRRADPVLPVPFHRVDLDVVLGRTCSGVGVFGVGIDLTLEGPEPWHAHGTASLSFLFFSDRHRYRLHLGRQRQHHAATGRGDADPDRRVRQAEQLARDAAHRVEPAGLAAQAQPRRSRSSCCIRSARCRSASGRFPLDLTLDTVGNQKPDDANRFSLSVTSPDLVQTATLTEPFAPSQFKHGRRRHQALPAGVRAAGQRHRDVRGRPAVRVRHHDRPDRPRRRDDHRHQAAPLLVEVHPLPGDAVPARPARQRRRPVDRCPARASSRPIPSTARSRSARRRSRSPAERQHGVPARRRPPSPARPRPATTSTGRSPPTPPWPARCTSCPHFEVAP